MRRQRGSIVLWFALMAPFLIGVVGLATDAGYVYNQRLHLQAIADDAARTGAERLDLGAYYNRQVVAIDPPAARVAALAYLAAVAPDDQAAVLADPRQVEVTVHETVPLPFLRAIGISTAIVGAQSVAAPLPRGG